MPTQAAFQQVAADLFSVFADFAKPTTFTRPGSGGVYDPITGETTGGTPAHASTAPAIRQDYEAQEVDGQAVQRNDFKLLVRKATLNTDPRADSVTVSFGGRQCRIINAELDAADAVWTLQVRQL